MAVLGDVLLTVKDLTKKIGDREILKGLTFTLHRGHRIGIIGANGVGKTTFMRLLAGQDKEFNGKLEHGPNVRVGYVSQEPVLDPKRTARENIEDGTAHIRALIDGYNALTEKMGEETNAAALDKITDKLGRLQDQIDHYDAWQLDYHIDRAMEALRTPPGDKLVDTMSGGERRRVALCRELMGAPDLLILDEPTNHLDAATVEWLELFIEEYPGTVVMVTHDRYFLDNVADFMVEIEDASLRVFEGNYSNYLEQKSILLDRQLKAENKRKKILDRELEWLRSSPKARTTKNKSRITNYHTLLEQGPVERAGEMSLMLPVGERLGDRVVRAVNLSKTLGDKVLYHSLNFELRPGEILGITGPNGTGKTTLLKILLGEMAPDSGSIELGETVKHCYVEQNRLSLNDHKTVFDEINDGVDDIRIGGRLLPIRDYLSRFGFKGTQQQTKVGDLSGGERNRLTLAKAFRQGANLILLDEPTNDLDIATLRLLEEALDQYPGSAIVISHDRYFLDRLVTGILVFEEGAEPRYYDGTFEDYFEARQKEAAAKGEKTGKKRRTSYRRMR